MPRPTSLLTAISVLEASSAARVVSSSDRKSVVEGKRGDFGGGRIIKKKKKTNMASGKGISKKKTTFKYLNEKMDAHATKHFAVVTIGFQGTCSQPTAVKPVNRIRVKD